MSEWLVTIHPKYRGAWAIVTAPTKDAALEKARAGEWESLEVENAELVDWEVGACEAND